MFPPLLPHPRSFLPFAHPRSSYTLAPSTLTSCSSNPIPPLNLFLYNLFLLNLFLLNLFTYDLFNYNFFTHNL
jgi:hypothetical protein